MIEIKGNLNRHNIWFEFTKIHKVIDSLEFAILKRNNRYYCFDVKSNLKQMNYLAGELLCPYCLEKLMFVNSYKKGNTVVKAHLKHNSKQGKLVKCPLNSGQRLSKKDLDSIYNDSAYIEIAIKNIIKDRINKNKLYIKVPIEFKVLKNENLQYKYRTLNIVKFSEKTSDNEFICKLIDEEMNEYLCILNSNYINIRNKKFDEWNLKGYNVIALKQLGYEDSHLTYDSELSSEIIFNDTIYEAHKKLLNLDSIKIEKEQTECRDNWYDEVHKKLISLETKKTENNTNLIEDTYNAIFNKLIKLGYEKEKTEYGYNWYDEDGITLISYEVILYTPDTKSRKKCVVPKVFIQEIKSNGCVFKFTGRVSYQSKLSSIEKVNEIYEVDK